MAEDPNFRFEFHNRVLWPDRSQLPAEAAQCAADQNQFWDYSGLLFQNQSSKGFTKEALVGFAGQLKLDTGAFGACLDSGKYKSLVEKETKEAADLGIKSTPTFALNGKFVKPAKSFDELITAARAELAKLKK